MFHHDVLIIGSGIAGLNLALSLANDNFQVAIISKDDLAAGSSPHAQGGIAAVMNNDKNSMELHIQDTLKAGAGLCDPSVVEMTVLQARIAIEWLINQGIRFSADDKNQYHLTQEGGHSQRRILHVADKTGLAITETLIKKITAHPNIECFTQYIAVDLLKEDTRCIGAIIYDTTQQRCLVFNATHTILATGGASFAYLHTSNPNRTSGDGIAMAWRAGCRVANLEFNQFHPTCLFHPAANYYLISEVVRGEGGYLLLPNGKRFMQYYDRRAEMASRDIVAYAIDSELKKNNIDCVYLDISHCSADFIKKTFPTIYKTCLKFNLDMTREPLPVVPAAHYTCGGVMTNINGQTDLSNLYAIGEVACTGLHGANRMASNSLLECVVFAANCARSIKNNHPHSHSQQIDLSKIKSITFNENKKLNTTIETLIQEVRKIMWHKVGIVRNNTNLIQAKKELQSILKQNKTILENQPLSKVLIEFRNLITIALLIVESALHRHESRGLHYNSDYPKTNHLAKNTILSHSIAAEILV